MIWCCQNAKNTLFNGFIDLSFYRSEYLIWFQLTQSCKTQSGTLKYRWLILCPTIINRYSKYHQRTHGLHKNYTVCWSNKDSDIDSDVFLLTDNGKLKNGRWTRPFKKCIRLRLYIIQMTSNNKSNKKVSHKLYNQDYTSLRCDNWRMVYKTKWKNAFITK